MNYLYKITNLINNKFYIGVRKSKDKNDSYMGSGHALKKAIKKYGIENFKKEIIETFNSYEDALKREEQVVNQEFILRKDTYNLRTGGIGGFEHINFLPKEKRKNLIALRKKIKEGLKVGGTQYWTEASYEKVRQTGWSYLVKKGIINLNTWEDLTEEQREIRRNKLSKRVSGSGNPCYGTRLYINKDYKEKLPSIIILNQKNRFKEGEQPKGWILLSDWRDSKKNKNSPVYGRHWYNDGKINYYLYPNDNKIKDLNLTKKRII